MRHLLISGLVLCGLGSCKTPTESSLQSLGALAGDKNPAVCSAASAADFSERYDTFWSQKSIVSDVDDLASDAVVLKKKISKFQTENNALKAKHDSERKELIKKQAAESAALHMPVKDKVDAFHTKMDLYYQRGFGDFENKLAEIAAIKKDLEQTPEQMQLMCCEPHEIKYLSDSQLGPHFKPRVDAKVAAYRADLQQKLAAVKASMPGRPVDLELAPPYSSLGYPGVRSMVPATPRLLPRPRKRKRGLLWMMGKVLQVLASSAQERLGKGPKPPKTLWLRC